MNYPGGKNATYRNLINLIPPHEVRIVTHVGSGPLLRNMRPARVNVGIDLDGEAIGALAERLPGCTVISGEAAAAVRISADIATSNDTSAKFFLVHGDCHEFLRAFDFGGNEFVYADPPYVMASRSCQRSMYKFEYDESDHVELLVLLCDLRCKVMVSGYWSELYGSVLMDWWTSTFSAVNRAGGIAEEWLWMNYPEPKRLHDYSFLGDDFRERERITRKAKRWVDGLKRLNRLERQAIISRMDEEGLLTF